MATVTQSSFVSDFHEALNKNGFEFAKRDVDEVLQVLQSTIVKNMKKKDDKDKAKFASVPVKYIGRFRLNKKKATKARKGTNPFTGEEMTIKAKPASRGVRISPDRKLKEAAGAR